ncbi:uncharacterized protein LOC124929169 [Impatiens glandulifera]|uniref:uncharacterized protein LOC124929169 n=1 Tax=Impatiens glandulifera TaxID=253017 RepID=UPI001FB09875|nr:uncharacterized protein LOC124929169 [Impatiens glandulifera]
MISVNASASSTSANVILNGNNFKDWKENVLIILGCMDLDLALWIDRPTITNEGTLDEKRDLEKWDRLNHMCLMIIKRGIPETFRGDISEVTNVKEFIEEIEKHFAKNDKAETSTLLASLTSIKYKGK